MREYVALVKFLDGWPAWQHVFNAGGFHAAWQWVQAPNREQALGKVEAWFIGLGYDVEVVDLMDGYDYWSEFGTVEV